ncbi:SdpI family protein [archaeon]|nr:SdpI family protein [archaeon]
MPLISIGLLALFKAIPRIDPLRKNIEKFRNYFDWFNALILLFLLYIHLLVIAWNLGYKFDFIALMAPALGALFYFTGVMLKHAKRNWFIGLRTPWTLSSDKVWDKTHAKAGKLFKLAGIIALFGAVFKEYALYLLLVPVIAFSAYLMIYSWLEFKKATVNRKARK